MDAVGRDFDLSMGSYQTGPSKSCGRGRAPLRHEEYREAMGRNLMGYSNPKVDQLFEAGERDRSEEARPESIMTSKHS